MINDSFLVVWPVHGGMGGCVRRFTILPRSVVNPVPCAQLEWAKTKVEADSF